MGNEKIIFVSCSSHKPPKSNKKWWINYRLSVNPCFAFCTSSSSFSYLFDAFTDQDSNLIHKYLKLDYEVREQSLLNDSLQWGMIIDRIDFALWSQRNIVLFSFFQKTDKQMKWSRL
jgi:hypothetical protein